jgi:hypothetical protein
VTTNPLGVPQRETAGPRTFEKYEYQYHWALCRVLSAHEAWPEYVAFVELHEDVVISTSTSEANCRFEFNQVKNVSAKQWKAKSLIARPKKAGNEKNSILGKLVLGVHGKPFIDRLDAINLVATCGFNLPLKQEGLSLEVISYGDLHEDCVDELQAAIKKELGEVEVPTILNFVRPDLPASGFQDVAIGRIARLIERLFPGSNHNPTNIYRLLIDDLHRKGAVAFDFTNWSELVRRKGLSREDVDLAIRSYSDRNSIANYLRDFESITTELGYRFHESVKLRRAFERYYNAISLGRSSATIEIRKALAIVVDSEIPIFEHSGITQFIASVESKLPSIVSEQISDLVEIRAMVIYELISRQ